MQSKKCPVTNKTRYFSQKSARRGITFIWSNDPNVQIGDLHTYWCVFCRSIHIGHKKKMKK